RPARLRGRGACSGAPARARRRASAHGSARARARSAALRARRVHRAHWRAAAAAGGASGAAALRRRTGRGMTRPPLAVVTGGAGTLCFACHLEGDVAIGIARLFNCYGPRLRANDGRVISNFIVQALRGEPLTVYGTGQQTRTFCYVDDAVEGLWRLMDAPIE